MAVEKTSLIPRSILRTFERFRQQLVPESEKIVIQEFLISRYQVLVSVRCLVSLICLPLVVNYLTKNFLLTPLTEYLWNTHQNEIFLNSYQQNRAFLEMKEFEEKLYFESLIDPCSNCSSCSSYKSRFVQAYHIKCDPAGQRSPTDAGKTKGNATNNQNYLIQKFQQKTLELAFVYNQQSIQAITHILGDFITFITINLLVIWMKPQIIILKSFLAESIYSLSDTTKSFLLILLTDLLVGFHSPKGWEVVIEVLLRRFGFPENQNFIFLFVGTFPVFLDTIFKYWIFRQLNKISPSTVATYHNMIE